MKLNTKDVINKESVAKLAGFLKDSCDKLKGGFEGCCVYPLSDDLVAAVGWSDGFNMDFSDGDIIKSKTDQRRIGDMTIGYAACFGIKVRNDFDFSDFDSMTTPFFPEGEVWEGDICGEPSPNMTQEDYEYAAESLLKSFVTITNLHEKGKILYA